MNPTPVDVVAELRAISHEMRAHRQQIADLQDTLVERFLYEISDGSKKKSTRALNGRAWAVGTRERYGFQIRIIVWTYTEAQQAKKNAEEIRAATVDVAKAPRRWKVKPK